MVLEKRKSFMQKKVVQKGACLDSGLHFFHAILDIVLIICLVIFAVA
jgi:hypothetical protein